MICNSIKWRKPLYGQIKCLAVRRLFYRKIMRRSDMTLHIIRFDMISSAGRLWHCHSLTKEWIWVFWHCVVWHCLQADYLHNRDMRSKLTLHCCNVKNYRRLISCKICNILLILIRYMNWEGNVRLKVNSLWVKAGSVVRWQDIVVVGMSPNLWCQNTLWCQENHRGYTCWICRVHFWEIYIIKI